MSLRRAEPAGGQGALRAVPEELWVRAAAGALCAVCALPCLMLPFSFQNDIYAQNLLFAALMRLGAALAGAVWAARALWRLAAEGPRAARAALAPGVLLPLALLAWAFVCAAAAFDPATAFEGDFYRQEGVWAYAGYAALYLAARIAGRGGRARRVLWCLCLLALPVSALGYAQFFGLAPVLGGVRGAVPGPFSQFNHFGYYLAVTAAGFAGLYLTESRPLPRRLALAGLAAQSLLLIWNDTTGALLALVFVLALAPLLFRRREGRLRGGALLPLAVLAAMWLLSLLATPRVLASVSGIFGGFGAVLADLLGQELPAGVDPGRAGSGRWELWRQAWAFFLERPVLGWGPDNLALRYGMEAVAYGSRPHNEYLQVLATLGAPGAALYLGQLGGLAAGLLRRVKTLPGPVLAAALAAGAYAVSALFGNSMPYTYSFFALLLGLAAGGMHSQEEARP